MGNKKKRRDLERNSMQNIRSSLLSNKRLLLLVCILIFAFLGAWILRDSQAASPSSPIATTSCGARVQNYTYQVPYGKAVWNQPVCSLARYSRSAEFADRFMKWANLNDGTPADQQRVAGRMGVGFGFPQPTLFDPDGLSTLFSRNVYDAADATTTMKIYAFQYDSNLDGVNWNDTPLIARPGYVSKNPDTPIPWNPDWKTGEAGDNEIVILDKQNGKIYEVSGYKRGLAAISQCGIYASDRLCTYTVNIGRDLNSNVIDYRTFEGYHDGRGVGLSMFATFTMPEEIAAGEIRHALGVAIPNTSYGIPCTSAQLGTTAESVTCSTALAPATKIEWGGAAITSLPMAPNDVIRNLYTIDKTIPEGMRFALNIDDAYIENWLNSRTDLANNSRKKETVRIFARAMRDYGFIIADTSGNGAGIQVAGAVNPKTKQLWNDLGIASDSDGNIFDGLITSSNLYVVDPPTNKCNDGTSSKYFCHWTSSSYSTTTPSDTTKPVLSVSSPANGSSVPEGVVTVNATATDNVAVAKVEFFVDNSTTAAASDTTTPYSSGSSINLTAGSHTIKVVASDTASPANTTTVTLNLTVTATPVAKTCDFNKDNAVTLIDLGILISSYNKTVTINTNGDCNGDGKVTLIDLGILINGYGK